MNEVTISQVSFTEWSILVRSGVDIACILLAEYLLRVHTEGHKKGCIEE